MSSKPLLAALAAAFLGCSGADDLAVPNGLTPPSGLEVTPVSPGTLKVQWMPVEVATSYRLERRRDLTGPFEVLIAAAPQSLPGPIIYFDTDLPPDTHYGYRVIAVDRLGAASGPSTVGGARTPSLPGIEVQTFYQGTDPLLADPDGYIAAVEGADTARGAVGVSASRRFTPLAPGPYTVRLEGVSPACTIQQGESRTVVVTDQTAQTIATALFIANCRDATRGDIHLGVDVGGQAAAGSAFHVDISGIANDATLPDSLRIYTAVRNFGAGGGQLSLDGLRPGTYQFTLGALPAGCTMQGGMAALREVSLAALARDTVRYAIQCIPPVSNQGPTARANGPYAGVAGAPIAFSSAGSIDPDGTIVSYAWDFGDGGTSGAPSPAHAYAAPGTYTARLTVTDNGGRIASDAAVVVVSAPGSQSLTWSSSFGQPETIGGVTLVPMVIALDLSADLPETPGTEALASWVVQLLQWDPAVLQFEDIAFGAGASGLANTSNVAQGRLSATAGIAAPGATGLAPLAVVRFRPVGAAGSHTTTATTLGALLSPGGYNYKGKTTIVEGTFTTPGGGPAPSGNALTGTWTVSGSTATLEFRINIASGNVTSLQATFQPNSSRLTYTGSSAAASPVFPNGTAGNPPQPAGVTFGAFSTAPGGETGNLGVIRLSFSIGAGSPGVVQGTIQNFQVVDRNFADVTPAFTVSIPPLTLP